MKVKTENLTHLALDWAVAAAQDCIPKDWNASYSNWEAPKYSTDWALSGPIIEKNRIRISWENSGSGYCLAFVRGAAADGPTPLIAAMRCYIKSVLGDEVEIPDKLL